MGRWGLMKGSLGQSSRVLPLKEIETREGEGVSLRRLT